MTSRQYDLVIFGATGYTGKLTAEHICKSLPTDLKWALAGRSASKLEAVAVECKAINANRIQPEIEVCELTDEGLSSLAKKTKLVIATVGPYAQHGEHAFKACAENGTHYLDVTGEIPFTAAMIRKFETTAKKSGSIMISLSGFESVPADILTFSLVQTIKEKFSAPTADVTLSLHEIKGGASGGTLATIFSFLDVYSLKEIRASMTPYAISPKPGPKIPDNVSLTTKLFGVRTVSDLGILTTSPTGTTNEAVVQRSWGLLDYGPNFRFHEYLKSRNYVTAVAFHLGLALAFGLLAIPIFRKFARKFVYQQGEGPSKEDYKNDRFEYRGIAVPDIQKPNPPKVHCRARFAGSLYAFTGICLAEAAASILKDGHELSGGVYTPACLGQKFLDRLQTAGLVTENKVYDQ